MNALNSADARCGNDGCPRSADPGEAYCFSCELERSLYRRDSRRTERPQRPDEPEREIESPASR